MGIKPLYYASLDDGTFIFGSELKSLAVHKKFPREIDPLAVEEYFTFGYVPDPRTIYSGVKKLSPGYRLLLRRGQRTIAPSQYWDIPFQPGFIDDEVSVREELITRLRDAVGIRLVSDVPLGAFLSGGVDSSAVVAMMALESKGTVNTCSISFGDPRYNESQYAAAVAKQYKTSHREEQVDSDVFDLIGRLSDIYDEPFADSSALPTYRVCELAKKQVTVVLSGDGGDESLAGYRRYRWHVEEERLRAFLPDTFRRTVFGSLGYIYPKATWLPKILRAKATFESLARDSIEGYLHSVSFLPEEYRSHLFSNSLKRDLQGYGAIEVLRNHIKHAPVEHPLSLVQYLDMKTYLPGDILTKVDRASMAHALEVRVPILDHELVSWISGLPPELKLKGREGKHIFKKALQPYLADDILYRRKMGFAVPLASWFRGPLREKVRDNILGPTMADSGFFNRAYLENIVSQHESGKHNHSAVIWALMMFDSFLRKQGTA
jgi:asparagine synthase (glutamine-hydrolysing)